MAVARLAPGYAGALAQLGEAPTRRARRGRPSPAAERAPGRLARWWLRDPAERAAFKLTAVYLRPDRETKARLYPSLGERRRARQGQRMDSARPATAQR